MHRTKLRAQVAIVTAICFASLAALAHQAPGTHEAGCDRPAWALLSWEGDCR
jgi:hypothetical protein